MDIIKGENVNEVKIKEVPVEEFAGHFTQVHSGVYLTRLSA
jgi:hypothetical protein